MSKLNLTGPLTFEPIFMERLWGGRELETRFDKRLPTGMRVGESWEIVDRSEVQSIVRNGPLRGSTLHQLWTRYRLEIFGNISNASRFPLLLKLLDAHETLSLQVHPTEKVAVKLGGEPKTEFWYVAAAEPDAQLFVGLNQALTRKQFEEALSSGTIAEHVHAIPIKAGDAMFLPAGRLHAVGPGNLLIEIQQNSDTTYRVFDWNRIDENGKSRPLQVEQALQCIDLNDVTPNLTKPEGEVFVRHGLFEIQKWNLVSPREIARRGEFAIVCCLTGSLRCSDVDLAPGEFFLMPAQLRARQLKPLRTKTSLLRVTIPR